MCNGRLKRELERIEHVMRMENESPTKEAVHGWYKKLEEVSKSPWKKRKIVLYRKRIINEACIAWSDNERLMMDRSG